MSESLFNEKINTVGRNIAKLRKQIAEAKQPRKVMNKTQLKNWADIKKAQVEVIDVILRDIVRPVRDSIL